MASTLRRAALAARLAPRSLSARPCALAPLVRASSSTSSSSSSSAPPPPEPEPTTLIERASRIFEQPAARMAGSEKMLNQMREGRGWREALESGLYEQQKLKRQDNVRDEINKLATMDSYGFEDLSAQLREALHALEEGMTTAQRARLFADRLSGGDTSATIEKQKADAQAKLAIIDELNPHERAKPKLLDRAARAAIAQKLGLDTQAVDELVFQYQVQRAQWSFVRREALRGREVPQSSDELEWRMKLKPTREFVQVMRGYEERKKEEERRRNPPDDQKQRAKQAQARRSRKRFGWGA